MTTISDFDSPPVAGALDTVSLVQYLRDVGEIDLADEIENDAQPTMPKRRNETYGLSLPKRKPHAWEHTSHTYGYIAPSNGTDETIQIQHAGSIAADTRLRGRKVKITLDRLRVVDYPGGGEHQLLFDFSAQNQVASDVENLHFNRTYKVREQEHAAVINYPIFVGLNVGMNGLAFHCKTVNVHNSDDEALLSFLDNDVFKTGLRLVNAIQPAIAPLSQMAVGLTKGIAEHRKNVTIQYFEMGLDFNSVPTGARLAVGSYIAVQIPEALYLAWDWREWVYDVSAGHVTSADGQNRLIPFNYLVFGVGPYVEEQSKKEVSRKA